MKVEKVTAYRIDGILYEDRAKAVATVRAAVIEAVIRDVPEDQDPNSSEEVIKLIADKWDKIEQEVSKAIGSI